MLRRLYEALPAFCTMPWACGKRLDQSIFRCRNGHPVCEDGSPRLDADVDKADGRVVVAHDCLPFGMEFAQSRDTNSIRFTGKERDAESGLDCFATGIIPALKDVSQAPILTPVRSYIF
jgi:hypothetical protein